MNRERIVQLGSNLYALPSEVVRIYKTDPSPSLPERPDGIVYVVLRSGGMSDCYRHTDWPIERVARVLGLSDGTEMHEMMEAE